ncbi:MAG: HIT family protein, partial [Rhabdochlamydiaceae bacterium]
MAFVSTVDCIEGEGDLKNSIPRQALASDSLFIEQKGQENPSELFRMVKKVAQFWEQQGIFNYLVYKSSADQGWEMVPTQGSEQSLWDRICGFTRQLNVLAKVTFGRSSVSNPERKRVFTKYQELQSFQVKETAETVNQVVKDVFCKETVINSQLLWEGKHVRVLYNYAPIGKEGLHFLLIPKIHKERLSQLSQDEFEEIQTFAATLIKQYPNHLCYRYNKTGKLSGQTVPHFHEHVVFVLPQHDRWGKLSVFFRMILP